MDVVRADGYFICELSEMGASRFKKKLTDGIARRQKPAPKIPQRFERSLVSSGVLVDDV